MKETTRRTLFWAVSGLLGALVLHVPMAAQDGGAVPTTGAAAVETSGLGAGVGAGLSEGRVMVPFAGVYAVTVALGHDTANFFIRIPAQAEFKLMAAPARSHGKHVPPAPVGGMVIPLLIGTDSATLPRTLGNEPPTGGYMFAAPEGTPGASGTRWWVTVLAGADTTEATGASRLSRALLQVQQQREQLELSCLTDPKAENDAAKRREEPLPCDVASRLPVHRGEELGDGILYLGNDGRARLEQRTETAGGELTMWGSRVVRPGARGEFRKQ
jgi:hypothetical protein